MRDDIELLAEERTSDETPGVRVSGPVLVSVIAHSLLIVLLIHFYRPIQSDDNPVPMARYIQLIKQNPQDFVEAPGPTREKASLNALWSDANRKASTPRPTGDQPTLRPGDGRSMIPRASDLGPRASEAVAVSTPPVESEIRTAPIERPAADTVAKASLAGANVNWHSVIKEVGKVATLAGGENLDLSKLGGEGGEKGFAEQGPMSFETQWYDWGEYAQSMVGKIRLHWYENMPPLIRTGMKGVVTIRFTIQRDGRITDIEMLNSSTVPPYDFAAKHAIELSSPLNPLPKDFPNASERVTCMFFYNSEPPK